VSAGQAKADMVVSNLKCESLTNPLGLDELHPRLSWWLSSRQRGQVQTAYRVQVAGSSEALAKGKPDLWDSGRVASDQSIHVVYRGKPLTSRLRCWWRVRAWDRDGKPSAWSQPATWEMALLKPADWRAKWIGAVASQPDDEGGGPAPYLRREFTLRGSIRSARAYVCGLGYYELSLNGSRVGDHVLAPNQTDYDERGLRKLLYPVGNRTRKRVLYNVLDVTSLLRPGRNAVGLVLGNGWYNQRERRVEGWLWYGPPRAVLRIEVSYTDGGRQTLVTDETWQVAAGPITANSLFVGEDYDARLELRAWDRAGGALGAADAGAAWRPALVLAPPSGVLRAQVSPPDRVVRTLKPISVAHPKPDVAVYDLGENTAGWARIRVRGPRGSRLTLRFSEEQGGDYGQVDHYTLKGGGVEAWEPRFTWHGFRTVEVSGLEPGVELLSLEGRVVHSDVASAGAFSCSNPMLNRLQSAYLRTQLANLHGSVPSDCPHRERLGYTGDGQVTAESALWSLEMAPLLAKWIGDVGDAQDLTSGFVPHTAPFEGGGGGPAWGSALAIVPWTLYQLTGDRRVLETHFEGMKRWVRYLGTRTDADGIITHEEPGGWCLGDWCTPEPIKLSPELVNTCYYARVAQLTSQVASVLGHAPEARQYRALATRGAQAVNRRFLDTRAGRYADGRQGADLFPLAFGLVPPEHRKAILADVLRNLESRGGHLDTGILGTPLLLDVLTESGHTDRAYQSMTQTTFPGYGFPLSKGATTLWEDWNGGSSHNHPMFGSFSAWLYRSLAGIRPDPAHPGLKRVILRPETAPGLASAGAHHDGPYGRVSCRWRRTASGLSVSLTVPTNTTATLYLPASDPSAVTEGGIPAPKAGGVRCLSREGDRQVYLVGSGHYEFRVTASSTKAPAR
jgi:alpha-L-rhamnosidase